MLIKILLGQNPKHKIPKTSMYGCMCKDKWKKKSQNLWNKDFYIGLLVFAEEII